MHFFVYPHNAHNNVDNSKKTCINTPIQTVHVPVIVWLTLNV